MSKELSVFEQMKLGTNECIEAIKREIGVKTTCIPFAVKLVEALNSLCIKTEQEALDAANTVLSGLQTLTQGGIIAEDYDKIDFIKRGKLIVPSARVEAFLRAAARKGYRITDTIVAVPKEDRDTTYFKENFYNGNIIYTLEDCRYNSDRVITAQRLIDKYFDKFICRLDIHDIKKNSRIAMTVCEMSIDDIMMIASASEQGIFKSHWEEYSTKWGTKKRKIMTNEINSGTFWINWTGEMVNKTVIRRALKRVKEVLPELTNSIYAFEQDEFINTNSSTCDEPLMLSIPVEAANVKLESLTNEQKADVKEIYDLYVANPKLAEDKVKEIKQMFESGSTAQEVINKEYASISVLKLSKSKWTDIGGYFSEENKTETGNVSMGKGESKQDRK